MIRLLDPISRRVRKVLQTKSERRHAMVGPAHLWKMKREFQIRFLQDRGLQPAHHLLEIGCGTLRGGLPILEYLETGHYFGTEVREAALDEGRKELLEAGLTDKEPCLLHAESVSDLQIDRRFDYIWSFSVLIHLHDEILHEILGFVARQLADDGAFYANVNFGERAQGVWQGFPIVFRSLEFYVAAAGTHGLQVEDLGPLRDVGHVSGVEDADAQRMLKFTLRS